ncbi:hypothetical protein M5K25_020913 [Dendrobium thyrsiflorum]|uniref:RNase H type-1 domain-containing protein n=1 Tax=Dendrobium thyrsiflorum TaxID=117978 RepID=A0ABD0UB38_DENTH
METLFNKFLWGSKTGNHSIIWESWRNCSGAMDEGKLGFKNLNDMTRSFTHKMWYSFRANKSLWAKFMITKYYGVKHPLICVARNDDSFNSKRLCKIKWEAKEFILWGLGEGNIYFWQDKWLGNFSIDNILFTHSTSTSKVKDFFCDEGWNIESLVNNVPDCIIKIIMKISIHLEEEDCILFNRSNDGKFDTKQVWNSIRDSHPKNIFYLSLWHGSIPPTYSFLIWRILNNYLPVDSNLLKKGFYIVSKCQCCYHIENINHVFMQGPVAMKVWIHFNNMFKVLSTTHFNNVGDLLKGWFTPTKGHIRNIIPVLICWFLWSSRNNAKHENIKMDASTIISKVKNKVFQLFVAKLLKADSFNGFHNVACEFGLVFGPITVTDNIRLILWKKPSEGCFKLNTDGAKNNFNVGCGGIIRDSNGSVIVDFAAPSTAIHAIQAEIEGLFLGINLCNSLGISSVWIEVDAMLLIHFVDVFVMVGFGFISAVQILEELDIELLYLYGFWCWGAQDYEYYVHLRTHMLLSILFTSVLSMTERSMDVHGLAWRVVHDKRPKLDKEPLFVIISLALAFVLMLHQVTLREPTLQVWPSRLVSYRGLIPSHISMKTFFSNTTSKQGTSSYKGEQEIKLMTAITSSRGLRI